MCLAKGNRDSLRHTVNQSFPSDIFPEPSRRGLTKGRDGIMSFCVQLFHRPSPRLTFFVSVGKKEESDGRDMEKMDASEPRAKSMKENLERQATGDSGIACLSFVFFYSSPGDLCWEELSAGRKPGPADVSQHRSPIGSEICWRGGCVVRASPLRPHNTRFVEEAPSTNHSSPTNVPRLPTHGDS